jgi:ABC-2 type transport system ATP-binding protein
MISVRGLTKQYGVVRAVDGLTFDVEAGSVTGFLGPNGAGKSTTMRMVTTAPGASSPPCNGLRRAGFSLPPVPVSSS